MRQLLTKLGLGFVLIANVIDAITTIKIIKNGPFEEANPLMEIALNSSPLTFVIVKTALVVLSLFILIKHSDNLLAQLGGYFLFVVYLALIASFYYFVPPELIFK